MVVLGAIVGAIVGFAIGILFVEVIFANNQSWPDVVPFCSGGRRRARRKPGCASDPW